MTVEEIDIIVEASVEQAVKEFKKLLPAIKKQLDGIQKEFNKINIKDITANIDMSQVIKKVKQAKKQIKDTFNPNDISGMTIDGKAFKIENIKGYSKEVQKLKGQIGTLSRFKTDNSQIEMPQIKNTRAQTPRTENIGQTNQYSIWTNMLRKYYAILDMAKAKMYQLRQETNQTGTSQNRWASFFGGLKGKIQQVNSIAESIRTIFSKMPNVTKIVTNNIKKMGLGIKSGFGHVLKYAGALFSIRGIYNILSNSASSWLSSQNAGAQQLSANIEYLKYSMGSVFAPIIQTVINLIYQLMKVIQSVVYAFSGINIFAKATASSMGKTAGSAKQASKSLAGVHNEINNVSENNNSGGSGGSITPNIDLSQMDSQMSPLAQKLHNFFSPLVDSWNTYGTGLIEQVKTTVSQIGGLISSVWGSFEKIITNGTVYSILENILAIIGNIAEAFVNAWNYNGNGDVIVQNLANAFNNLLKIINDIVSSTIFQWLLDIAVGAIKIVTDAIKELTDAVLWISEKIGEFIGFFTGENSEKIDGWAIIIGSIATAIGLVVGAITLWNVVTTIAIGIGKLLGAVIAFLTSPILGIIAIIAAIITVVVLVVQNWEWLSQKATEIFTALGEFFTNIWKGICDITTNIWNDICNFLKGIWDWIVGTVTNTFNNIKQFIIDTLNMISFIWSNIWNGLKNTVINIFNEIWKGIKTVINWILGGIEGMGNGVVNGINTVIRALNRVSFKMPDWLGGGQFGFNIQTLNAVSIPRLAKGNVAYSPLIAQFGEYSGASHNPEITAPQNVLKETFDEVLSDHEWNNGNNSSPVQLTVQVGNRKIGEILLDNLRDMKRRTGKNIEVLVGG